MLVFRVSLITPRSIPPKHHAGQNNGFIFYVMFRTGVEVLVFFFFFCVGAVAPEYRIGANAHDLGRDLTLKQGRRGEGNR